jgi:phosphinothricin acetyltransferase
MKWHAPGGNLIRPVTAADSPAIARIYNHYVRNTVVTFEEDDVSAQEMARRIDGVLNASLPWLVAEREGLVRGYAYASKWHGRSAYRYSAETTVYLDPSETGKGLGSELYKNLINMARERSIHALIGVIALPNPASVALHDRLGVLKVGEFRQVGFKFGGWVDVGYWEAHP